MFTFLSRFYDENPTILLVIFCLTLLLWIYFVLSDFFKFCTDQNRFDITLPQKKPKSLKISKESFCKRIAWINGKKCRIRFSFLIIYILFLQKQLNLFYMQTKKLYLHFIYYMFTQCQSKATDFPQEHISS